MRAPLQLGAALLACLVAGCQAPPEPLWAEDLEVEVAGWDFNDANLVVALRVEAPAVLPEGSEVDLQMRVQELSLPQAPFDPRQGQISHRLLSDGVTAIDFKSRLVNPGLVPEKELRIKAELLLTYRGPARIGAFGGWTRGATGETWEHPGVPGLTLRLERLEAGAASFVWAGGAGGRLEVALRAPGRISLPVEEVRMGQVIRLEFLDGCPRDAELLVAWRPERRCHAQLEAELSDPSE